MTDTGPANRDIRYQAVILDGSSILMLRYDPPNGETFWLLPGGGREPGETEAECIQREVLEETFLIIRIERRLADQPAAPEGDYDTLRSYLCSTVSGTARPGYEPDLNGSESLTIEEARWFDLPDETSWPIELLGDQFKANSLRRIRGEVLRA